MATNLGIQEMINQAHSMLAQQSLTANTWATNTDWRPQQMVVDPGQLIGWDTGVDINTETLMPHWNGGRPMARREPRESDKQVAMNEMAGLKEGAVEVGIKDEKKTTRAMDLLKDLGFEQLHKHTSAIAERAMKENLIGVAGYKKIFADKFEAARKRVQQKSEYACDLLLTPVEAYLGQNVTITPGSYVVDQELSLPPMDVLEKVASAKKDGLFDSFAVIHVAKVHDPILVGQVKGSKDLYFIAEWGDDISLEELMK